MKAVFIIAILAISASVYAQPAKIDLSRAPGSSGLSTGKSNATILNETTTIPSTIDSGNIQYSSDGTITEGTYRGLPANNNMAQPGNANLNVSPSMMNATYHQGNIGKLETESATYYDNSGKIQSTNTIIKLGK